VLPEDAAVILVGARARHEFDLSRPFGGAVRPCRRGGEGDFFNGVGARGNKCKKGAGAVLVDVVLNVNPVEGHVEGALGESVDGGVARPAYGLRAGLGDDQVERVTGLQRKIVDLNSGQVGGNGGGGGLQHLGAALHLDGFGDGPEFEGQVDGGRNAGVQLGIFDGG